MEAIYYTVSNINGDYAELVSDDGQKHDQRAVWRRQCEQLLEVAGE